jgi:Histidine phosphatase superfamily (branch 1)
MTPTPRVFIVRHGETEWSLNGRHTGTTELELTPDGEKRVRATGQSLVGSDRLIVPSQIAHMYVYGLFMQVVGSQLNRHENGTKTCWDNSTSQNEPRVLFSSCWDIPIVVLREETWHPDIATATSRLAVVLSGRSSFLAWAATRLHHGRLILAAPSRMGSSSRHKTQRSPMFRSRKQSENGTTATTRD